MATRAKFKVNSITRTMSTRVVRGADGQPSSTTEQVEQWTLKASPVYHNGDPEHENSKFWNYTPGGSLELTTVNADALAGFDLGGEFYVDLTPALVS